MTRERLRRHGLGWLGLGVVTLVVVAALGAPWIAPHDPVTGDFAAGLKPPGTPGHPLGTDLLGRDLLSRVLYGARVALFIGLCTVLVTAVGGGLLGLVAGFFGGWPGTALMRLVDVQLSFPFILLALTINAIVGLGLRNIILSLSAAGWVVYARVVRGEVLSVKQREYVQAAAALGTGQARILFRHVLPNVLPSIIIVASLQFSQFIVAEAAISFLGFGVQPPTPAWGNMLSESRDYLYVANTNSVVRFRYKPGQTKAEGPAEKICALPGQGYRQHWTRNVIFRPARRRSGWKSTCDILLQPRWGERCESAWKSWAWRGRRWFSRPASGMMRKRSERRNIVGGSSMLIASCAESRPRRGGSLLDRGGTPAHSSLW